MCEDNGILIGLVVDRKDLDDPDRLGRVRVVFPTLDDQKSYWARVASPMAGKGRGVYMIPDIGDEVLCALEHGDPRRPYIIGALWSKPDKPPPSDNKPSENNWRFIQSRAGHRLIFDDTQGAEKVTLTDMDEVQIGVKRKLVIDPVNKKIQVICDEGDVEVTVKRGNVSVETQAGNVSVNATGDISLKASGTISIEGATVAIKATGTGSVEASGPLTIKGATVNIN